MNYGAITAPAGDIFEVTPDDSAVQHATSLWVIGGGNVSVETEAGNDVTIPGVPDNTFIPLRVNRVLATGTTATVIYGFRE